MNPELVLPSGCVNVNSGNVRSFRVIEANGGVQEDEITLVGTSMVECRYWIDLDR